MRHMSFFNSGDATDERYLTLRDGQNGLVAEGRDFVESLWAECRPFLDADLPEKARSAYFAAFWELYLAHALLIHDLNLIPRAEREPAVHGPDLLATDPRVWLEATAPYPGEGANAVREGRPGEARSVPDDQIILRYRSAISAKNDQFNRHRDRGWIASEEATIVALNGAQIPSARAELTIPRIVRSVLPFGPETFHLDPHTFEFVDRSFAYRAHVEKKGGVTVPVDIFLDESHAGISALLASCADEINRPETPGPDFALVHNPYATCPLPRRWFCAGHEYWVEDDKLHCDRHGSD